MMLLEPEIHLGQDVTKLDAQSPEVGRQVGEALASLFVGHHGTGHAGAGGILPERLPACKSLLTDQAGHLWVEQYRPPWDEERRWWVFDPDGRWLGEPSLPPDVDIREVGDDYVLGVRRDENGVERVVMLELARRG